MELRFARVHGLFGSSGHRYGTGTPVPGSSTKARSNQSQPGRHGQMSRLEILSTAPSIVPTKKLPKIQLKIVSQRVIKGHGLFGSSGYWYPGYPVHPPRHARTNRSLGFNVHGPYIGVIHGSVCLSASPPHTERRIQMARVRLGEKMG